MQAEATCMRLDHQRRQLLTMWFITTISSTRDKHLLVFSATPATILHAHWEPPSLILGRSARTIPYHSSTSNLVDDAVGLIVNIALVDHSDSSKCHQDLKLELKALQQTLVLTDSAIRAYDDPPLGQILVNTVKPEIQRCRMALLELLNTVDGAWQGLAFTTIRDLWRPVFGMRWDGGELVSLKTRLHHFRTLLGGFLMALNSYVVLVSHAFPPTK